MLRVSGWCWSRKGELGSGLRLLGARAFERADKCLGFGIWRVGWSKWSRGRVGDLGSGLMLFSARAFEKGGQVLGVDMVVSGPRGRTREWAQAASCEGV